MCICHLLLKDLPTLVAKIVDTLQHLADRHSNFDYTAKIYLFNNILQITHGIFFVVGGCVFFLFTVSKDCFTIYIRLIAFC